MTLLFNVVSDRIVSDTMGRCISFVNDLFHSWFCIVGADDFCERKVWRLKFLSMNYFIHSWYSIGNSSVKTDRCAYK